MVFDVLEMLTIIYKKFTGFELMGRFEKASTFCLSINYASASRITSSIHMIHAVL